MPKTADANMLQMALIGYEAERQKIQDKIAEIRARLDGRSGRATSPKAGAAVPRTRRKMSAAARRRIAAAQRLRWIEYRKKKQKAV
jgi:hypothetical protein